MSFPSFLYRQLFVHPPPIPSNISLKDQTVLITGGNSGIGLEGARECVRLNAKVLILAVRSMSRAKTAKSDILKSNPGAATQVEIWELDLESFESVLAFWGKIQSLPRLDIAMMNAGVFKFEWGTSSSTGIESDLQVNHLSTALLSLFTLPVLQKTSQNLKRPARLTFTSSDVRKWTSFKERKEPNILEHLNQKEYFKDTMDRYSVTKLLNVFWIRELATKVSGDVVVINFFDPGSVDTGLHRDGNAFIQTFDRVVGRTPEEGGKLLMDAVVAKGRETHGNYLSEAKLTESSKMVKSKEGSQLQKKLWDETIVLLRKHLHAEEMNELLTIFE